MSLFVPPRPAPKAGPTGPGAGPLMTEFLLPSVLRISQQQQMKAAIDLGREVAWIAAAEGVISTKIADPLMGVQWHLEDPSGETIDETYADARAVEAFNLVDKPMAALKGQVATIRTREEIWEITSRHMGLAGQGAWHLAMLNDFGIPAAVTYIAPYRLNEKLDDDGDLTGWVLDKRPGSDGVPLDVDEIVLVQLQTPDAKIWAPGLIESARAKGMLNSAIDRHFAQVLAGGGRLSGILAPKTGAIDDDGIYNQMVRDWRNVTEQPESARRLQVVRAPIDFTKTVLSPDEMKLIDLMEKNRNDILAVWRVPLSQVGGSNPAGLNSGDVRKYDEAALWQNAVTPRLSRFNAVLQMLLDRFEPYLGWAPKLVFDIPEFDDDSPRFDKIQKSQFAPLTNDERRALLGLPPLAEVLGVDNGEGKQIIMSNTQVPYADLGLAAETQAGLAAQSAAMAADDIPSKARREPKYVFGRLNPHYHGGATEASAGAKPQRKRAVKKKPLTRRGMRRTPMLRYLRSRSVSPRYAEAVFHGAYAKTTNLADLAQGKQKGAAVVPAVLAALKKQWPAEQLTLVKQGSWKYDPAYPLKKIDYARRPVARNPQIVAGVEAALSLGAPIDPVVLVNVKRLGNAKPTEPIDGWHRLLAAEHAGLDTVPAYIGKGDDAWTKQVIAFDDQIPTPADSYGKALGMRELRAGVTARVTPSLAQSVRSVLAAQRDDVAGRVKARYAEIQRKPNDTSLWWKAPNGQRDPWDAAMTAALSPHLQGVAQTVRAHVQTALPKRPAKAVIAPRGAVAHVLERGAARVKGINETTRAGIAAIVAQGIDDGMDPAELGDAIENWSGWDEYRSELIARTELMDAYNAAALGSYDEFGVTQVQAIDGDGDEECAARNGQVFSIEEADTIEDHPNGTLDWVPVLPEEA